MKIRPQKHARLGFSGKKRNQRRHGAGVQKTRKELRKEKRQQKKLNRFNYHNRKRQQHGKPGDDEEQRLSGGKKKMNPEDSEEEEEDDFEDEEIESDFEDEAEEQSSTKVSSNKAEASGGGGVMGQLEKEREQEMRELRSYEQGLKEKRISQLQAANEEDEAIIKRYEKLLKINRRKNKEGVPKSFNDGLDYCLELCTDDNIRKMYEAAREAADLEVNSEDEFENDVQEALGKKGNKNKPEKKVIVNDKKGNKKKDAQRMERLKKIEKKYLGDDDLDSLTGFDSEIEIDLDEHAEEDYSDNDELYESDEMEDSGSDAPSDENEPKKKKDKKSKKVTFVEQAEEKSAKKDKKKKKVNIEEPEPEEDSEFDEDVFGGDSDEDDGLDDLLDGIESDKGEDNEEQQPALKENELWEDIYGRKRDREGNVVKDQPTGGKYIPPHMRARMEAEKGLGQDSKRQEKLLRLKRQLKGQINRLAESNVHRISIELDNLYMQNARFDMNSTLTTLILEALLAPVLASERMVLEHTLLVAILHANVGSEVGSHFLETVVEKFTSLMDQIQSLDVEDKSLDNSVLILCHLFTFQILKNKLIYDVIDRLIAQFNEKAVECILLVLRSIGFVLRKDDPLALKEMIQKVQKRASEVPAELKNDTRVKFMLDTLLAVKNNNMNKIPQYDPSLVEHFRKLLKGMITQGKYVSSLNIGLEDLLRIDERGKWWLVGSAWHGKQDGKDAAKNGSLPSDSGAFSQQLLELARKQRMNTDDKRNVFCVIMSAEDYLDAFDKILRLSIKDQRIVATVLLHCCLAEKDYNPYYSVLAQKFCEYDRRYQLAIQFAIWDRLKDIHSLKQAPVKNLAKLLTHLISEGGLALSVLKVIEFAEIDKLTLRLVRQTMLGILLNEDENKCLQVFNRVAPSFKLKGFKDSLRLFLHHFLLKGSSKTEESEELRLLQERIRMADRMLDTSESRVHF
ncbi:nucleolar MIF4G domain-containing protein 1 homolog [Uranotaenia lowii]|uniref:nucleolar MIF4G domain-containing protein 1 homolog n=1 Tax=Uranotaenia lowii TaxID=190385 RepID=UPI002479CDCF|nr:nucleolar MIF4G domain-containing protein 1 homolog [Uranotaenia lowii]